MMEMRLLLLALALLPADRWSLMQSAPSRPELVVQNGHVRIDGVAISRSGRYVLATGVPTLLWDLASGLVVRSFPVELGEPSFTNDDAWIVVRERGNHVARMFSVATGEELVPGAGVEIRAVSHDGRILALAEPDSRSIRLWDRSADRVIGTMVLSGSRIDDAQFSADGRWMVTRSFDFQTRRVFVEVWRAAGGSRTGVFESSAAGQITISPDSRLVAIIADKNAVELRALENWSDRRELRRTTDTSLALASLAFSADGRWLAGSAAGPFFGQNESGTPDPTRSITVWNTADGRVAASLRTPFDHTQGMHFGGAGRWLIASGWLADRSGADVGAMAWDVNGGWRPHPRGDAFRSHERPGAISSDGTFAVTLDKRSLRIVNMDGALVRTLDAPVLEIGSIAISDDGRWLAAAEAVTSDTHRMKVWDIAVGGLPRRFDATGAVREVGFLGDGRLMTVGSTHVSIWDPAAGTRLQALRGTIDGAITSAAACASGDLIAAASVGTDSRITVFDSRSGAQVSTWGLEVLALGTVPVAISPDCTSVEYAGTIWDARTGRIGERADVRKPPIPVFERPTGFSADGRWLATYDSLHRVAALRAMESTDPAPRFTVQASGPLRFTRNPQRVLAPNGSNIEILDTSTGQRIASVTMLPEADAWVATTPEGLFDGSPAGWRRVHWRFAGTFDLLPVDAFFGDFYTPDLLKLALEGEAPRPAREIASLDRRSPQLALEKPASFDPAGRTIRLRLRAAEAPADAAHPAGTGVHDIRVFRNGTLVRAWRGGVVAPGGGPAVLEADIRLVAGENRFVAYAFNRDNVKGRDAELVVTQQGPARQGVAYVIAIGVNRYADPAFDLKHAVADAQLFSRQFADAQTRLGQFARVDTVVIPDHEATGANIRRALSTLERTGPEDLVAIFFAGHGVADRPRFNLIPHDGAAAAISDRDLAQLLEPVDAGTILLVIDACESGQVLESEDRRLGPLNVKGLAQLAYEKGMYVLTASQSYQAALEVDRLGHGLLTYALVEEGLQNAAADRLPADGTIRAGEWLDYAVSRVPEIQIDIVRATRGNLVFNRVDGLRTPGSRALQQPRVYYRREGGQPDVAVARRSVRSDRPVEDVDMQTALTAASSGDARMQFAVGRAYLFGIDVPADPAAAERWLRRAADQNVVAAQATLGLIYMQGKDLPRDYAASLQFLTPAAAAGDAMACTLLGMHYEFGFGVDRDDARAAALYGTAASKGDQDAQYRLGELYLAGRGVPRDRAQATAWFEKAAAQGHPEALRRLKEIRTP